jgi:hypothetical protein
LAVPQGMVLAAFLAAAAPAPTVRPALDVAVVVEPDVAVSDADLSAIAAGVRAIWRPAADVRLRRSTGDPGAVLPRETIELVLTHRVRRISGPALGWVDFVAGAPQPVVTVSVTEVDALLHAGRWQGRAIESYPGLMRVRFVRQALTYAAAHEIGHYLLQTTEHAKRGLMQASVAVDDIADPRGRAGRLSPDEVARVRERRETLAARNDEAPHP